MKKLKRYQYERYALLCKLIYQLEFDISSVDYPVSGYRAIVDKRGRVLVYLLWGHKKEVVLVFRGSQYLSDWLVNLNFSPVRCHTGDGYAHVHKGYWQQLHRKSFIDGNTTPMTMIDAISHLIGPLIDQGKRISLTGHSSGGAIAVLAADRLEREYPGKVRRVVTFGQPAVGFHSFRRLYPLAHRTFRVCCDLDIVTFLPPLPWVYWHVGRMLWLHEEQIYENVPDHIRLAKTISSWLLRPITYHKMSKYIRRKELFDRH